MRMVAYFMLCTHGNKKTHHHAKACHQHKQCNSRLKPVMGSRGRRTRPYKQTKQANCTSSKGKRRRHLNKQQEKHIKSHTPPHQNATAQHSPDGG